MKPFRTYQHLEGYPMTDRDKMEIGSKFWNEGKWNNFVAPFLLSLTSPEARRELVLVDMGCNSGLFLKLAQDWGFGRVVGVDSDREAVRRGVEWRDKNDGNYEIRRQNMENCIEDLPLADYTVLANAHYYFTINDWLDYLDKLQYKTRYCIIVTAEKRSKQACWASADISDIRKYFKSWEEVGFINVISDDGSPGYRKLWGICFKSPYIERVPIDDLDRGNHVQDNFYGEIDKGLPFQETKYYKIMKPYRNNLSDDRLNNWFKDRIALFEDVRKNGLKRPVYINSNKRILDGNHKSSILEYLGFKTVIVRET